MSDNSPMSGYIDPLPQAVRDAALRVFGSEERVHHWLHQPAIGLGGRRPVELLTEPDGAAVLLSLLRRLDHGVYT